MGTTADRICVLASRPPAPLAREVLDFIGWLATMHGLRDLRTEDFRAAPGPAMYHARDNSTAEVLNDL
jgi:hypothetical protein